MLARGDAGQGDGLGGEELTAERSAQDAEALSRGELPPEARRRLRELEGGGASWTSDLSVAELAAVRSVGFEPVGLVMGTSVYHLGSQWQTSVGSWGQPSWAGVAGSWQRSYPCPHVFYHDGARTGYNWEHSVYERGLLEARDLAHGRILAEASELGAHGVAGVRWELRALPDVAGVVELQMVGTALRRPGRPPARTPFTSHLSGQDLAKLLRAGMAPARLVMAVAAIEADPGCGTDLRLGSWSNTRLPQYSDASQACRELAVTHLQEQSAEVADAVVGADVSYRVHELAAEAKLFEMLVVGTAVRRFARPAEEELPISILRLSDPPVALG